MKFLRITQTQTHVCAFLNFVADKKLQPSKHAGDNSADNKNNLLSLSIQPLA